MTAPKWAVNAANRFVVPAEMKDNGSDGFRANDWNHGTEIDVEKFHAALVALQLRAYRRGAKDGAMMNLDAKVQLFRNRGKTAGDGK